jgi:hypothetical protein
MARSRENFFFTLVVSDTAGGGLFAQQRKLCFLTNPEMKMSFITHRQILNIIILHANQEFKTKIVGLFTSRSYNSCTAWIL